MQHADVSTNDATGRPSKIRDRTLVVVAAAVGGLIVWAIARLIIGEDLTATASGADSPTTVGPAPVIIVSLVGGLVAWGFLALPERFTARAGRIWLIVAVVVLLLSLAGPLAQANGTGTTIALLIMHLVVGSILIAGLTRTTSTRS